MFFFQPFAELKGTLHSYLQVVTQVSQDKMHDVWVTGGVFVDTNEESLADGDTNKRVDNIELVLSTDNNNCSETLILRFWREYLK